jgi:hypothetical protein
MSKARHDFISRLRAYRSAVEAEILVNKAPTDHEHNQRAKILRSGLSVVGFSILEDFIDDRSTEILARIGNSAVQFERLPEKLREATTIGVIRALNFQIGLIRSNDEKDVTSFVQRHARLVASTSETGYQLSGLALGAMRSNLNHEDVKQMLHTFRIKDPWGKIDKIASRVGLGAPSLQDAFKGAMRRRHEGAHKADADPETTDLQFYYNQALGIAIGFDALISYGLKYILDANSDFLSGSQEVEQSKIPFRFVDQSDNGEWREVAEGKLRAYRVGDDFEHVKDNALARARSRSEILVVRNTNEIPRGWYIPFSA